MSLTYLALDEVLALHEDQIGRYGARPGMRDLGLLSSAIGTPAATFDGKFNPSGEPPRSRERTVLPQRATGMQMPPIQHRPASSE